MKNPTIIRNPLKSLNRLALILGLAASAALLTDQAQAATATNVYTLSPTILTNNAIHTPPIIAPGTLPAGSTLESVSVNVTLSASTDAYTYVNDFVVYFPTFLQISGLPTLVAGSSASTIVTWSSGAGGVGTSLTETKIAGTDFPVGIDLNVTGVSIGNDYTITSSGTWGGTITVVYDIPGPAEITSFGLPGFPSLINQNTKTIVMPVPYGTDLTQVAPTYTLSSGTGLPASGSTQNFSTGPVSYTVSDPANSVTNTYAVTANPATPTIIAAGTTFSIDNNNTTLSGTNRTWNGTGATVIYNGATLHTHPTQSPGMANNDAFIFTGTAGTITLNYNGNDTDFTMKGPFTSTATGAQTLAVFTGCDGNGDRESVTFNSGLPNVGDGSPLSLNVTFTTQTGSQSWVNLNATNTFTGPLTLAKGANVTSAYLTIGGTLTRYHGNTIGSGKLGNGNYPGAIALGNSAIILNYASTANQILAGPISGPGALTMTGSGTLTLAGTNTYTGNTTVTNGTLVLATNGVMAFTVTDAAINQVTGAGTATFNGQFSFDTSAVTRLSGSWTNVTGANKTYGPNFSVAGFTGPVGNVWTKVVGASTYTFNQTNSSLTLSSKGAITFFGFVGGAAGVINNGALTIAWTVPYCADLTSLAPTYTLSSGTCVPASGSAQDFSHGPVTYTVTDGTTTNHYVVTATHATTITTVINLGSGTPTNNSTTIGKGQFIPVVPQGSLPAGSILRQIQFTGNVVSSDQGNWAAELMLAFDPTPNAVGGEGNDLLEICANPVPEGGTLCTFGALENEFWANGYGTAVSDTKTFGINWTNSIDLHSNAVFLANGWDSPNPGGTGSGSWSGTIILTYDIIPSDLKQITAFTFPTIPGTTTTIFGTNISVVVPPGTDVTALTPSYTFCGASCLPLASVTQNFTNPVSYTVTAADASTQTYLVSVTVQLPPHTSIPTGVTLSTNNPDLFVAGAGVYVELFNNATLTFAPTNTTTTFAFTNRLVFTGTGGTNYLRFNGNDKVYTLSGAINSTATNSQTLAIFTGNAGNGDREEVSFLAGIPDVRDGSPYGLFVNFRTQSASYSYVNLEGSNTFTGPITLQKGPSVSFAYLTIGGRGYTTGAVNQYLLTPGTGNLGGGNYPGAISLSTNIILDYASSANQILSGVISATGPGLGALVKDGPGTLTLAGLNTFTGNTTVNTNTLVLATNGGLSFLVTDSTNNQVNGKGTATLNGTFSIDTSGVVASTTGIWPLVNTATQSYGPTFSVAGYTKNGNLWQQVNGTKVWTFDTTSGKLYLSGPAAILTLGIPGSAAVINGLNIALTVPWSPWGTNGLAALAPTYTLSSGTCVPSSGVAPTPTFATQNPATYSVTDGAYNNNYTVTVTITPALTNNLMANVFFPGFGYAFPDATGTNFTLVVPGSTTVTALAPTYTVSTAAAGSPVSGTTRDFTTPQTYTVTAQSGAVQAYSVNVQKIATVKTGYQEIVLASGPISYWPLNETSGTTFFDIASGLNNMTNTGFILNQTGLRPDGVPSAYCSSNLTSTVLGWAGCPFNQSLNPATFSVECWIKVDESVSAGAQYLVSIQDRSASVPTGGRWGYSIQRNNGTGFNFSWGTLTSPGVGNFATISSTNTLEPVINTVYHVVGTYDGSTMKLYVNGVLENSTPVPAGTYMAGTATDPGFSIGSRVGNTGRNCWMQDVALYGHALTQQEIQTHLVNSPLFQYTQTGSNLNFTWSPASGTLQGSTNLTGPYTNLSTTQPATVPITGAISNAFWRVKF